MIKWIKSLFAPKSKSVPKQVAQVWAQVQKHKGTSKDFSNARYIAEVNLGLNSKYNRLHVWDSKTGKLYSYKTSHGSGGANKKPHDGFCRQVGNISGSHLSCLGLFECAETYVGKLGYCLRLDGLSATNNKARPRAILIHSANYVVQDSGGICGMSWGCFALDNSHNKKVINMLRNGSPLFAHFNGKLKI